VTTRQVAQRSRVARVYHKDTKKAASRPMRPVLRNEARPADTGTTAVSIGWRTLTDIFGNSSFTFAPKLGPLPRKFRLCPCRILAFRSSSLDWARTVRNLDITDDGRPPEPPVGGSRQLPVPFHDPYFRFSPEGRMRGPESAGGGCGAGFAVRGRSSAVQVDGGLGRLMAPGPVDPNVGRFYSRGAIRCKSC
jgi:hypothetical protein